jgi:hypothetical protein
MKYVITDKDEVVVGNDYHRELARGLEGNVIRAGECERLKDGWTVYGKSIGYRISALNSDRDILNKEFVLKQNNI